MLSVWQPMDEAPKEQGAIIVALGYDAWPAGANPAPIYVTECKRWYVGEATGWSRTNAGHGYTVGFVPIWWMPRPETP